MVLEKTLKNPLKRKKKRIPWTVRSNQSLLKEISPEYSSERLIAEADAPILWPPDVKSQLNENSYDAGKD